MKHNWVLGILLIVLIAVGVSAGVIVEPWIQNQEGNQHNLTDMDVIQANTFLGSIIGNVTGNITGNLDVDGNVTANYFIGDSSFLNGFMWTNNSGTANHDGNANVTGNITGNFILADGSLLSGLNGSLWVNSSGVAVYNGSALVVDNLSVDENVIVSESVFVGTGTDALITSLWGSTYYFNLTYPANFNQNISFDKSVGIGTLTPSYPLHVVGNTSGITAYFEGNISAAGYNDHTKGFEGTPDDALALIINIKNKDGEIDHSSLPVFAKGPNYLKFNRSSKIVNVNYDDCDYDEFGNASNCVSKSYDKVVNTVVYEEKESRDLGAMITLLTDAVKSLNNKIVLLEVELCKKDGTYPFCA